MRAISDYELELMKIIWSCGGRALYADIVEGLAGRSENWTKNTIITLLSRLVEKGLLTTNKIGRRNEYVSLISETEYQAEQTETFLHKIYEGNAMELVSTLIQNSRISASDYEELKKFWEGGEITDE